MAKNPLKHVDGGNVLYHYLQKTLQEEDIWLFQMLVAKLIVALGVWFPPHVYARFPIALPFVIRDPNCRKPVDEWSAPNESGYLRDDNSLIKALHKSLSVDPASFAGYRKRRLGTGFIAAHVWRETTDGGLASRTASTNSFWPNLVWLPANVAKLTDREGSFAQGFVQAISTKMYRDIKLQGPLGDFVEEAWSMLPEAPEVPSQALPNPEDLNFFDVPEAYIDRRLERIRGVVDGLRLVEVGKPVADKVVTKRYTAGLNGLDVEAARALRIRLEGYVDAAEAANS